MKLILSKVILLLLLLQIHTIPAQAKQIDSLTRMAMVAIEQNDYVAAIRHYEQLLPLNPSSTTYYNLGVCYTQAERPTDAIIAYERALLLDPSLKEARHNLRLLYTSTKDNLGDGRAFLWLDNICYAWSISTLTWISYALFSSVIILFLVFWSYRCQRAYKASRYSFFGACFITICWLFSIAFISHQLYYHSKDNSRAIIHQTQELKPTPTGQGNTITTLHEGTPIFLIDEPLGHFQKIALPDGRTGWLPQTSFTLVVPRTIAVH